MARISSKISESLSEYLILTDWIKTKPEQVFLETNLGPISLQYPYITARMQCVVGPEMAVAAGRNGILTIIPRSLREKDKQKIINANKKARLKKGDIEFIDEPEIALPNSTLEEVVKQVERTGHSVIPIMDRKSKVYGVYIHNPDNPALVPPHTPITELMFPLRKQNSREGVPYLVNNENINEIKKILSDEEKKFLLIVNENMILQKLAFLQRYDTNFIGIAISTKEKWKEELEKWGSQVDTLCIDSSNACFDDAVKILKYVKESSEFKDKPFGIGNIIQGKHFKTFAEAGADYIMGGMGVGSICQTGSKRGNGRGQFTVAKELAEARDEYAKNGRYVPFVLDGCIRNVKDMTVALAFADFIMMGNYFNRFFEAPAQKFDVDRQPTSEETFIKYVETWGEGHPRARLVAMYGMDFRKTLSEGTQRTLTEGQKNIEIRKALFEGTPIEGQKNIERYGHMSISGATIEGIIGLTEYKGRLKPNVERDARYLRTTISNAGAYDLKSFRKNVIKNSLLEKASPGTILDMLPHDVEITEEKR